MPGPTIAGLSLTESPDRWRELGFAVALDDVCRVGAIELALGAAGEGGLVGWALTGPPHGDVDGIPTAYRAAPAGSAPAHVNGATRVDHVVLVSPDVARTLGVLLDVGMRPRHQRAAGSLLRPMRQVFFRHGEAVVELVGPSEREGDGPARLWGVTFAVTDLDACAALRGAQLGPVHAAVQPGRRIASVVREAGLRLGVAFMDA